MLLLLVACGAPNSDDPAATGSFSTGPLTQAELFAAARALLAEAPATHLPEHEPGELGEAIRLIDRFDTAELTTEYVSRAASATELLSTGSVSSRAPPPGYRVVEEIDRLGEPITWIVLENVDLAAADIGEVVVRGRFENASRFIFTWSKRGRFPVAVQDVEGSGEYSIKTDGLTSWLGRVKPRFGVVGEPSRPEPHLTLESVKVRSARDSHVEAAGIAPCRLSVEVRECIYLHPGTRISFPKIQLPKNARLKFGAAVRGAPVQLRISLRDAADAAVDLFDGTISNASRFRDELITIPERAARGDLALVIEAVGEPEDVVLLSGLTLFRPRSAPPLVLFYLIDCLGSVHVHSYGYERETTPVLDALAREGVRFENAHANAPWTPESVPSMMTSLHQKSNGVWKLFAKLTPRFTTMQEVFAAGGFATAAFSTNANAGPRKGTAQGFDSFFDHLATGGSGTTWKGRYYDKTTRTVPIPEVLTWLDDNRERPRFVYIHTAEPHWPYAPPPPFDERFSVPRAPDGERVQLGGKSWDVERVRSLHDGEVAFADFMLGELLTELRQRGLLENALVIVTSDHGEALGERGQYGHSHDLSPELLRVPIVFWGPSFLDRPREVRHDVQLLDLMPTLLELFELEGPAVMQGDSLVPLLRGEDAARFRDRPVLATLNRLGPGEFALMLGEWKLHVSAAGKSGPVVRLFNRREDPGEYRDLATQHPDVTRRLLARLIGEHGALPRYETGRERSYEISEEHVERLRALGYVQ